MGHSSAFTISLDATSGLRDAEVLRERLIHALQTQHAVEIDAAGVRDIDISIIQLLIAARKTARNLGRSFRLAGPCNGVLADALVRGGFMSSSGECLIYDDAFWTEHGVPA